MNSKYPYGIQVDTELDALYELAVQIGERSSGDEQRSFTSVLLAFLSARDPVSRWFQRYVSKEQINREKIAQSKDFSWEVWNASASTSLPLDASKKVEWSRSAREVLISSLMLAEKVGGEGQAVGIRHVMGAYSAFHFPNHEMQLRRWGFEPKSWFTALIEFFESSGMVADPAEMDCWRQLSSEASLYGRQGSALSREHLTGLRQVLVGLYSDPKTIATFVHDAGLDRTRIDLTGSADNLWQAVLSEANRANSLPDLVERARRDYPRNQELLGFT